MVQKEIFTKQFLASYAWWHYSSSITEQKRSPRRKKAHGMYNDVVSRESLYSSMGQPCTFYELNGLVFEWESAESLVNDF